MSLQDEIRTLTQGYVRKGGKDNRHQQRGRMEKFADYCAEHGARSLGQIGKGQVIGYWKAHRHLAPRTLHAHWLALCELWRLAGKPGQPPRPRLDAQPAKTPEKGPEGPLPGKVAHQSRSAASTVVREAT